MLNSSSNGGNSRIGNGMKSFVPMSRELCLQALTRSCIACGDAANVIPEIVMFIGWEFDLCSADEERFFPQKCSESSTYPAPLIVFFHAGV